MAEIAQKVGSCYELLDKPFPNHIDDGSQDKSYQRFISISGFFLSHTVTLISPTLQSHIFVLCTSRKQLKLKELHTEY